jgi:arylformamidase
MTATEIDYEVEYNNRARVPEHPAIFERWRAAAKEFRDEMAAQGRAELGLAYGATPRQFIDLFRAERAEREGGKLAVFVHGGYWRSLEPSTFSHVARGFLPHGISVAFVGYDLCPQVRVADIIGQIRQACLHLWRRFGARMFVYGHSAGGHLAACALATDWKAYDMPADAVPTACAISGVFDLTPLVGISMNEDLRLDPLEARRVSPLFWDAPRGRTLDVIVGTQESREFLRQSREIAEAWAKAGVTTRYEAPPGNHFTVLDPLADPGSAMTKRLAGLVDKTSV